MTDNLRALALSKRLGELANLEANELADVMNEAAEKLASMAAEIADHCKAYELLFKECGELRKDAERYRWLRKRNTVLDSIAIFTARRLTDAFGFFTQNELICDEEMDAAIDEAIDAAKGESHAD
jgi:hypothetical protein